MTKFYLRRTVGVLGEIIESVIADDGRQFSVTEENADYRSYLAWLDEGNEPQEWNPES